MSHNIHSNAFIKSFSPYYGVKEAAKAKKLSKGATIASHIFASIMLYVPGINMFCGLLNLRGAIKNRKNATTPAEKAETNATLARTIIMSSGLGTCLMPVDAIGTAVKAHKLSKTR